ncbi:hypothetical protein B0H13DRAFT_2307998 [Mycena leptocephala]|nr:hypothetical protein B0H13DRAFT_2307998 [Mycena leptocephala]
MPFPELAGVGTMKGEETAVPKLNEHQQSWILDIGVRAIDLPSLKGKAHGHTQQPTDREEEARLPGLVDAWKQKQRSKKNNNSAADDDDASDEEEDESGRGGLLRGYTKAGWRKAIQKVITHAEAPALSKLLGIVASGGRDKFRKDRHDAIEEHSKTLKTRSMRWQVSQG